MEEKKMLKMALISGAAHALEFKNKNPRASDEEIIQHVSNESDQMVDKLGSED
jgi:hypothetical protein